MSHGDITHPQIIDKKMLLTLVVTIGTIMGGGGMWVGTTTTQLVNATQALSASIQIESEARKNLERRTSTLETADGRTDQRLLNLVEGLDRLERAQSRTNSLLQQMVQDNR